MKLNNQEILRFDVVDSQNMIIPRDIKIDNLGSEYDLTYDFKSKVIGKVRNIKVDGNALIGDIEITDSNIKLNIKDFIFRPAFESTEIENKDGKRILHDLNLMYISMISKEKDIYD